ncbi:MAG: TIGR02206 family membrane protein [Deltaproteobacteria bacterium]|nr:TIGR02206 family membrane protein [Deltaproteobacteria bacterium]
MSNGAPAFRLFDAAHLTVLVLTVALPLLLALAVRRSERTARLAAFGIAGALLLNETVYLPYRLATSPVGLVVREFLPLHLCGFSVFIVAIVLVWRQQLLFECAYFWALSATLGALLTPSLKEGFPHYLFFHFFIQHGGVIASVLYAAIALRLRPRPGSVLRVFVITQFVCAALLALDCLLGANYMFLLAAPDAATPLYFLPWPWYLAFLDAFGLAFFSLLYLPFWIARRRQSRSI